MKKAILIIISILLLSCLFASTALAAPAESMLLRAGGSVGGGGGGGFGGFSRSHSDSKTAAKLKDMTGNDMLGMFLFYLLYFAFYLISLLGAILIPIIVSKRKKKAREETRRLMAEYDDFDGFWSFEFVQKRIEEVYFEFSMPGVITI